MVWYFFNFTFFSMRVNSNSLCDCIVSTFTAETRAENDIHCSTEKSITKQRGGGYSVISLSHKPHHRVFYLLLLVIKQPLVLIVFRLLLPGITFGTPITSSARFSHVFLD